ncbi:hypothetical protein BDV96DRAFT_639781 [Lophiotrema nucula]|uniref:Sodium/calcium exchanger membrane region domain-containing protein n=1 Tax=Lophiotrema nucula TaxID=690887 RepID=A0A6A5ZU58_9PLEO|nr:hypothetical protein BDV96DRAFT_639781 [Lophiotrema nucula]
MNSALTKNHARLNWKDQETGEWRYNPLQRRVQSTIDVSQAGRQNTGEQKDSFAPPPPPPHRATTTPTTAPPLIREGSRFKRIFRSEQFPEDDFTERDIVPIRGKYRYLGQNIESYTQYRSLVRHIPVRRQLRKVFIDSWMYLLIPFIVAGFAVNYSHCPPATTFSVNFIAILPSAAILGISIEELSLRLGNVYGALLSMTFSNAVQLITSVLLLKSHQITILQTSLLGAILSNLLLMTGLGFFLGGFRRLEQYFNPRKAQTISMLLLLAVLSIVIPTTSHLLTNTTPDGIVAQSRGTSVVILISYGLYVLFQYFTNRALYSDEASITSPKAKERPGLKLGEGDLLRAIAATGAAAAAAAGGGVNGDRLLRDVEDEIDRDVYQEASLSLFGGILTLTFSVVFVAFNTQFATDNLQGLLEHTGISQNFVGLVIIPILSNDPMSIKTAMLDHMDESIALTLERCMQTALMVVPCVVIIAWCMGIDQMSLEFDGFTTAALFASIIIVTYVVQEGKSNWLTGALLIKIYVIIALAAFYNK